MSTPKAMSYTKVVVRKAEIDRLTEEVRKNFRCFGGGYYTPGNPVSAALAEGPTQFAAGVDVREVVEFILRQSAAKATNK